MMSEKTQLNIQVHGSKNAFLYRATTTLSELRGTVINKDRDNQSAMATVCSTVTKFYFQ